MIDFLIELDQTILVGINGFNSQWADNFMMLCSEKWVWVLLYAACVLSLIRVYGYRRAVYIFLGILATVLLCDMICHDVLRNIFQRLRPSNVDNPFSESLRFVNGYRGGTYGFPSLHATNSFTFATALSCIVSKKWVAIMLAVWALLNCYSRLYLGVHYPSDILCGAIIGVTVGYAASLIIKQFILKSRASDSKGGSMGVVFAGSNGVPNYTAPAMTLITTLFVISVYCTVLIML